MRELWEGSERKSVTKHPKREMDELLEIYSVCREKKEIKIE